MIDLERVELSQLEHELFAKKADGTHDAPLRQIREIELAQKAVKDAFARCTHKFFGHSCRRPNEHQIVFVQILGIK